MMVITMIHCIAYQKQTTYSKFLHDCLVSKKKDQLIFYEHEYAATGFIVRTEYPSVNKSSKILNLWYNGHNHYKQLVIYREAARRAVELAKNSSEACGILKTKFGITAQQIKEATNDSMNFFWNKFKKQKTGTSDKESNSKPSKDEDVETAAKRRKKSTKEDPDQKQSKRRNNEKASSTDTDSDTDDDSASERSVQSKINATKKRRKKRVDKSAERKKIMDYIENIPDEILQIHSNNVANFLTVLRTELDVNIHVHKKSTDPSFY